MDAESNESDLWVQARRDEGDAFGLLFDLHHDRVYRRAFGLMANVHDAEDVTAAAFFELWRKRRSVRLVNGSVLPWLLVTSVNLSRNARRSSSRYQQVLRTISREEPISTADVDALDSHKRLKDSLQQLSPVDAALFVLIAFEDMPVAEAAAAVGLKTSTARMRLHRTRARLRADLQDLNPTIRPAVEGNNS